MPKILKEKSPDKQDKVPQEVFLPWLIARRETLFFIFFTIFTLLMLVNQGGASDLRRAPAWAMIGFAFLAFLLFYFFEYARPHDAGLPLPSSRQKIFGIFFETIIVFLIFNIIFASATWDAVRESLNFISILLVMSLVSFYAQTREKIKFVIIILGAIGLFAAIHGLILYIKSGATLPLGSFFEWHNPAGGYFAAVLIIFLSWILSESPRKWLGRYGWIGGICTALALVFTLSRGAWLAFIPSFLLLLILLGIKRAYNRVGTISFAVILLIAITLAVAIGGRSLLEPVYQRLVSFSATQDFSVEGRRNFYSGAIEIFKDHPTTGVGLGSFGFIYPKYQKDPRFYAKDPHSFYLRLLSEGGIFGIIILIMILGGFFFLIRAYIKNQNKQNVPLAAGLVAALCSGLLHLAIDFDDTFPLILLNLGVIWVCGMNLLEPKIPQPVQPDPKKETPLIRGTLRGSSILLAILLFVAVIHCGRMYFSEASYDLGKIDSALNKWESAEKIYHQSLRYFPSNDRALLERSRALLFMHDSMMAGGDSSSSDANLVLQKAVASTGKLKNIAPYRSTTYFLSGMALIRLDDLEKHAEAVEDFQAALQLDSKNSPEFYIDASRAILEIDTIPTYRKLLKKFKSTYPYDKVEEYTRTRLEWENLPVIYEDMILLEVKVLKFEKKYSEALKLLPKIQELENVREKIQGKSFRPRKDALDQADRESAELKSLMEPAGELDSLIDEITRL